MMGVGEVIGHYRIVERIGEGGMGVVYRAHDERLGRDVALKFLPPNSLNDDNSRKRFHKEARTLAKLNHPNIATVYDFDSQDAIDFLVTEYIPGETLGAKLAAAPMPQKEVLRLGMQLADGLAAAHEAGVVHRDLKPGNLQLTPDGRLKILDFGLAQFFLPASTATTESVLDLPLAGTLPYQAPEQLRGEPASARSDIYAAGAVLYEMCTGRRAFGDAPAFQVIHSILHEMPKLPREIRPKISPQLEQVVLKCLDKDPESRYHSALELGVDLRRMSLPSTTTYIYPPPRRRFKWRKVAMGAAAIAVAIGALLAANPSWRKRFFTQPAPAGIQSLAVLPLKNFSGGSDQDYFADGMTDELITDLAQISALRVISRTSMMTYKGSNESLPQIAQDLKVDAVLEGSVERVRDRVQIKVNLIQAPTERHLLSKSYERNVGDVLTMQEEVARAIAGEIQIKLTADELRRLSRPRAVNPEAHESYLQGRYYWNKRTKEDLEKSIGYLQQAVAKDPKYALAYAALSDSYHLLPDLAGAPAGESLEKARSSALKALQLDPSLAEAHASVAKVKEDYDWDWAGAEHEYREAIELNPGLATLHAWYSNLLMEKARMPEALAEAKRAQQLDPLSSFANANLASILYFAGEYDEALEQSWKTLTIDPASPRIHRTIGSIYVEQRNYEKAIVEFKRAVELSPGTPEFLAELGFTYAVSGQTKEGVAILKQLQRARAHGEASSYSLAVVYAGSGDKEGVLRSLRESLAEHAAGTVKIKVSPLFKTFRSEPAFEDVVRQVGL